MPREHCVLVQLPLLALLDGLGISLKPPETSRQSQVTIANGSGEFGQDPLLTVSEGLRLVSGNGTRSRWEG